MDDDTYYYEESMEKPRMKCWLKTLIITGIVIFSLALLVFIGIFVVFPIVFMESLSVERTFMFWNIENPKNPEFDNPEKYGITGVNNFYITTKDSDSNYRNLVKIGVWQILPIDQEHSTEKDVEKLLRAETKYPILMYNHGVACTRIVPTQGYKILRKKFHIFAMDYRGYGDSTGADLSESGIIEDNVQVYEWIRSRTNQDIYIWGHSLGSALSIHTVKALWEEKRIVPKGLVVESAFSTMREEVLGNPLGKFFSWLAYFNATVLDPLEDHGFRFWSTKNINEVRCPTMHMHAADDNVISWKLGEKLMKAAQARNTYSGRTLWHLFPSLRGYQHNNIITDPNIPQYVDEFIELCNNYSDIQKQKILGN
ncbi:lysophosphatidylserine lipase ABHD12 isoform X2 [Aethina tumida]|nr:lysophosphatidylserine lipase ABHD12 isoform X2 [Aethina tumida]